MITAQHIIPKNNRVKNCFSSLSPSEVQHDHLFKILPMHQLSNSELEKLAYPRQSNDYQIICIKSGTAICKIDMEVCNLSEKHMGYIYPAQIYQILPEKEINGFIISFSREFFHLSVESLLFGNQANFIRKNNSAQFLLDDYIKEDIHEIIFRIEKEFASTRPLKYEVLKGLLKILLIYFSRISNGMMINPSPHKNNKTVKKFFLLLEEKYSTKRMATAYADNLAVTTNFLNDLLKKTTGSTTSYHIHQRILTEAKRLAVYSNITMKEIAYQLGFEDMAHFSKFFKKTSGESFKDFKKRIIQ